MMAPVAALSTGEGLRMAAPGSSASAAFRLAVATPVPAGEAGRA
jgi:hypothetical protein